MYGYFRSGAGDEVTLKDNEAAFGRWQIRPRMLSGVTQPDTCTRILGEKVASPLAVAPAAMQMMAHSDGVSDCEGQFGS